MGKPAAAESSLRQGKRQSKEGPRAPKFNWEFVALVHKLRQHLSATRTTAQKQDRETHSPPPPLIWARLEVSASIVPSQPRRTRCNMSEPTPVFDPPAIENGTSAVEAEGSAATTTTDNGGPKENNGQDVTMAGLEETGAKTAKTGADAAVSDNILLGVPPLLPIHLHLHIHIHHRQPPWPLPCNYIILTWPGLLPAYNHLSPLPVPGPSLLSHKATSSPPRSRPHQTRRRLAVKLRTSRKDKHEDGYPQHHLDS